MVRITQAITYNLPVLNWNTCLALVLIVLAVAALLAWSAYELNGGGSDDPYVAKHALGIAEPVEEPYQTFLGHGPIQSRRYVEGSPSKLRPKISPLNGRDEAGAGSGLGLVFRARPALKPTKSLLERDLPRLPGQSKKEHYKHEIFELTDTDRGDTVDDPLPHLSAIAVRPKSTLPLLRDSMAAGRPAKAVPGPGLSLPSQPKRQKQQKASRFDEERDIRLLDAAASFSHSSVDPTNHQDTGYF